MKHLLKNILYRFNSYPLNSDHEYCFCYVFHTEAIYSKNDFELLKKFCTDFFALTGKKPICTVMPANNPQIKATMANKNISEELYVDRLKELAAMSQIGYHGHFYKNGDELKPPAREKGTVTRQFNEEVEWFKKNEIDTNHCYSGGWWYMNEDLIELLVSNNFNIDFTFTYNQNFYNPFSKEFLKKNKIAVGQPFTAQKIKFIQTLIGCHNTPDLQDFRRNLNGLTGNIPAREKLIGALCTHDYNLGDTIKMTMDCLNDLSLNPLVSFFDLNDINKIDYKIIEGDR